ncbi:MAG: type II toxin-antitoxin system RelE/ParE family toxin [Hyphomicrobiaceae bacterium]|nr:type II toxin-antitoxin system RelE/ParE family toxin [Hyphomicrobiaceae bacterium]
MNYRLTGQAEEDILRIFVEGARLFGIDQAERYHLELTRLFELIAANPKLARERMEISPPVRMHPHKAHLIIYVTDEVGKVLIVRVRHAHEDWESEPI